ncbi:kinase-like domain-containing protein [Dunaliella salina]|uniref:Kinase-like domain-containing protein n=1 Tax=Dunaliella salina TaxID=3046 RepID=A0ABQ7H9C3_DUNSA|nr:kinase-like domain-containing protein [Dunaliella salina]|eukprot:KAF5843451.1 kinase-like domain-containing protein [Dunaliella salina]
MLQVSTYFYDIRPVSHDDSAAVRSGLQVEGMTGVVDDWKLYLILEYCHFTLSYATTANFLHRGEKPRVDMILLLLLDMAKGMLYLHDHKIIHGDLKPENVLLKVDGQSPSRLVAKITDFGLAINLGPTATHVSNISTGTPFYCAPEVPLNGRATQASDVFSFGVVMAEVCSKTPPWINVGGEFHVNPRFPNFGSDMPRAFESLAMRCLQLDLTKRPGFQEIVSSLEGLHRMFREQELPRFRVAH